MLTFQLQLLAVSTLGCRHLHQTVTGAGQDPAEPIPAHCAHASQLLGSSDAAVAPGTASANADPISTASAALGDCHKCLLDLCLSAVLGLVHQPQLTASLLRSTPSSDRQPHFYRHSVDLWPRPPIPLLS